MEYILQDNDEFVLFGGAEFAILFHKYRFSFPEIEKKIKKVFGEGKIDTIVEIKIGYPEEMRDVFLIKDMKDIVIFDDIVAVDYGGKKHLFGNLNIKEAKKVAKSLFGEIRFKKNISFIRVSADQKEYVFLSLHHNIEGIDILVPPSFSGDIKFYRLCG